MTNLEKYNDVFVEVFAVAKENLNAEFASNNVDGWDSVKQLSLTVAIEDTFDIMMDPEDIMLFNGYAKGIEILNKYEIAI